MVQAALPTFVSTALYKYFLFSPVPKNLGRFSNVFSQVLPSVASEAVRLLVTTSVQFDPPSVELWIATVIDEGLRP